MTRAGKQTVLITGGSQGAHHINRAIAGGLRLLLDRAQVLHICGPAEESWLARERDQLPEWQRDRYRLLPYTDEMGLAMAASDLAITRAGASTLGELPSATLPANTRLRMPPCPWATSMTEPLTGG